MKVIPLIFIITSGAHTHACSHSDTQATKAYEYIHDYVIDCIVTPDISYFIIELCIYRDFGDFSILTSTKMSQLLEPLLDPLLAYTVFEEVYIPL